MAQGDILGILARNGAGKTTTLGGLFLPIQTMPATLRHISHATPMGAAVTAMQDTADGHWPHWLALVTLLTWAAGAAVAAVRLFRWE